jgi:hypothetical protein
MGILEKKVLLHFQSTCPQSSCPLNGLLCLQRPDDSSLRVMNKMFRVKSMVVKSPEKFDFYFDIQFGVALEFSRNFEKRRMKH